MKTYAYGWVILVAAGYNNPGGRGYLYVLNPNAPTRAGQLLKKIPLPNDTGTDTNPPDLTTIRAFTASRQNPYVLQAYGGDIKGNVWRCHHRKATRTAMGRPPMASARGAVQMALLRSNTKKRAGPMSRMSWAHAAAVISIGTGFAFLEVQAPITIAWVKLQNPAQGQEIVEAKDELLVDHVPSGETNRSSTSIR